MEASNASKTPEASISGRTAFSSSGVIGFKWSLVRSPMSCPSVFVEVSAILSTSRSSSVFSDPVSFLPATATSEATHIAATATGIAPTCAALHAAGWHTTVLRSGRLRSRSCDSRLECGGFRGDRTPGFSMTWARLRSSRCPGTLAFVLTGSHTPALYHRGRGRRPQVAEECICSFGILGVGGDGTCDLDAT
jgi:hypothetical protein